MADICNVVLAALRKNGSSILSNRDDFLKCIQNSLGNDTREAKLLGIGCDDTFLGYFSTAMEAATKESLLQAAQEAADYLTGMHVLDPEVSNEVARGIATGCSEFLGIEMASGADAKRGDAGYRKKKGAKRGVGATIVTSAAVFALMSALAAAILSHFYPTAATLECARINVVHLTGNLHAHEAFAASEPITPNERHALWNAYAREARATTEDAAVHVRHVRHGIWKVHSGEVLTVAKRTPSDRRQALWDKDAGQIVAAQKCLVPDHRHASQYHDIPTTTAVLHEHVVFDEETTLACHGTPPLEVSAS